MSTWPCLWPKGGHHQRPRDDHHLMTAMEAIRNEPPTVVAAAAKPADHQTVANEAIALNRRRYGQSPIAAAAELDDASIIFVCLQQEADPAVAADNPYRFLTMFRYEDTAYLEEVAVPNDTPTEPPETRRPALFLRVRTYCRSAGRRVCRTIRIAFACMPPI